MLRITELPGSETTRHLRVEGRLTAESVGELALACGLRDGERSHMLLDVARVVWSDQAGVELVRALVAGGATLVGCSPLLRALLHPPGRPARPAGEERLVARLRAGDGAAFETLVRTNGPRLLAVARRMLGGNDGDAHDVVQDALLQAYRGIQGFAEGGRLSTWLHRIVVNAALMKLRGRRRRPEEPIEELLPRFDEEGHRIGGSADWSSTEGLLERRETRAMVRRLVDRLPDTHRTVLVMRDLEDLDTDEVATALGVSPNAVKVRLHRARQALRELVAREVGRDRKALAAAS